MYVIRKLRKYLNYSFPFLSQSSSYLEQTVGKIIYTGQFWEQKRKKIRLNSIWSNPLILRITCIVLPILSLWFYPMLQCERLNASLYTMFIYPKHSFAFLTSWVINKQKYIYDATIKFTIVQTLMSEGATRDQSLMLQQTVINYISLRTLRMPFTIELFLSYFWIT